MDARAAIAAATQGPWPVIAALALALAAVLAMDRRRARDPRRLAAARLGAMLEHSLRDSRGVAAPTEATLFRTRRDGLLAVAGERLDRYAAGLGGRAGLRTLVLTGLAAGGAAGTGLAVFFGLPAAVAVAAGALAGALSFFFLAGERRRRWSLAFQDQLIEAVELFARTIRTGFAVPAAIRHTGDQLPEPVGPILRRIADQEDIGVEPRRAIREAALAVSMDDFTFFAVALILQRETGGEIGASLDNLHFVLRRRREARLKTQALTAQGRMSAKVVAAIPVVAFIGVYLLNPEQTGLMLQSDTGLTMLGVATALVVGGMLVVRWMVQARP